MNDVLTPEILERAFTRASEWHPPRPHTLLVTYEGKLWEMPVLQAIELCLVGKARPARFKEMGE